MWSVMETVQAFLKVSKLANKGQFERYSIRYLPNFISVNELKQYLLENYSEELSPASNCTSLTIGYGAENVTSKQKNSWTTPTEVLRMDGSPYGWIHTVPSNENRAR